VDNVNDSTPEKPDGNSRDAALRRLRKDRSDLHEQVIAGEMTPHGAMVDAGFRKRMVSFPAVDIEAARRVIEREFGLDGFCIHRDRTLPSASTYDSESATTR